MGVLPRVEQKTEIAAMRYTCLCECINKTECINELNRNSSPSNTKAGSCPSERITNGERKKIKKNKKIKNKKLTWDSGSSLGLLIANSFTISSSVCNPTAEFLQNVVIPFLICDSVIPRKSFHALQ